MILVAGEALVDMVMIVDDSATEMHDSSPIQFRGTVGGGPLNTAIAASRLGSEVHFLTAISTDHLGERIMSTLQASGVQKTFIQRNTLPTMLAFATLDAKGNAQYSFYMDGVSNTQLETDHLEAQLQQLGLPDLTLIGTLGLVLEPSADDLVILAKNVHDAGKIVIVDPNIRLLGIKNPHVLARRFDKVLSHVSIVKLSEEDAEFFTHSEFFPHGNALTPWLQKYHGEDIEIAPNNPIQAVIVTRGSQGISAITAYNRIDTSTLATSIADTIGAGDSVNGALLAWLDKHHIHTRESLSQLTSQQWQEIMSWCMRVAAVTVSRSGANPPWDYELSQA